jgi:fumarate reductase subunit D
MKRSNAPLVWSLFGAGGMLAALVGPALVFVTGIAVPAGILMSRDLMGYQRMAGFAHTWVGKAIILAVIVLFLWHAALRIFHMLHDFGVHAGTGAKLACFGLPLLCTLAAVYWALAL